MGFLDDILSGASSGGGSIQQGQPKKTPFAISSSFRPVRLKANSDNSCELVLKIKNQDSKDHICSVVAEVPNSLGFDEMGLSKTKELRLGNFPAGSSREVSVTISANTQTPPGTYRLFITANSHYRDYTHILNSVRKSVELRAV